MIKHTESVVSFTCFIIQFYSTNLETSRLGDSRCANTGPAITGVVCLASTHCGGLHAQLRNGHRRVLIQLVFSLSAPDRSNGHISQSLNLTHQRVAIKRVESPPNHPVMLITCPQANSLAKQGGKLKGRK